MFFLIFQGASPIARASVARCVAIIIILIINNGTFLGLNLIKKNTSKPTRLHQSFQNFRGEHVPEPPSISVADITIYESSHFLFNIPSKYRKHNGGARPKQLNDSSNDSLRRTSTVTDAETLNILV